MAEHRQKTVEEEVGRAREGRVKIGPGGASVSGTELKELEPYLRLTESEPVVRPSLERWTRFNEGLLKRMLESRRCRPLLRSWRQRLYDRLSAGDSRFRDNWWIIATIAFLALAIALGYLAR